MNTSEARLATTLFWYSLTLSASYTFLRAASDSLFLSRVGNDSLALVFVISGLATAAVSFAWYAVTRRAGISIGPVYFACRAGCADAGVLVFPSGSGFVRCLSLDAVLVGGSQRVHQCHQCRRGRERIVASQLQSSRLDPNRHGRSGGGDAGWTRDRMGGRFSGSASLALRVLGFRWICLARCHALETPCCAESQRRNGRQIGAHGTGDGAAAAMAGNRRAILSLHCVRSSFATGWPSS